MIGNCNLKLKLKSPELQNFKWLYNLVPCFPIHPSNISIITDPKKFYDTLCERFRNAQKRVAVASLYIGTGALETRLMSLTKENMLQRQNVSLKILLDFQRGTRGEVNSSTMLWGVMGDLHGKYNLHLYQTPRLFGTWSKILPSRYNELVGLQHMKLYIADDTVILSGANCSHDYFTQRQDRYIEITDPNLANFYNELIDEVSKFSKSCNETGIEKNQMYSKEEHIKKVQNSVKSFMKKWKAKQDNSALDLEAHNKDSAWVFPLVQMGEYGITQDEDVTSKFFQTAPEDSKISLATGYFNLTEHYTRTLLQDNKSQISLLMAHPNANGFMGAAGPAGGIPYAYSLIASEFWQKVRKAKQENRIKLLEYQREGWTFHAKGFWYYPPGSSVPWGTVVGSANLGERSVKRDLEAQAVILTTSPDLQRRLHDECQQLHKYATLCTEDLEERKTPMWVRASVGLFRTYF